MVAGESEYGLSEYGPLLLLPMVAGEFVEEEEDTLFVNGMYNYIVWVQSSTIKQYLQHIDGFVTWHAAVFL